MTSSVLRCIYLKSYLRYSRTKHQLLETLTRLGLELGLGLGLGLRLGLGLVLVLEVRWRMQINNKPF